MFFVFFVFLVCVMFTLALFAIFQQKFYACIALYLKKWIMYDQHFVNRKKYAIFEFENNSSPWWDIVCVCFFLRRI